MMAAKKPLMYEQPSENEEENFLILLTRGNTVKVAAAASGFTLQRYTNLCAAAKRGNEEASAFVERVEQAKAKAVVEYMQVLRQAALAGEYRAGVEWLKAMQKDEFGADNKIIIEHKVTENLEILIQKIESLLPPQIFEELMEGLQMKQFVQDEIIDAEIIQPAQLPEYKDED